MAGTSTDYQTFNSPPQAGSSISLTHESSSSVHIDINSTIDPTQIKLVTWNIWATPLASPRTFTNPYRCSKFLSNYALHEEWNNFNGLIFVGIQECWGWRCGIIPNCFLSHIFFYIEYIPCIGRILSFIFQLLCILSIFFCQCLPCNYYNPKKIFHKYIKQYLPYATYSQDVQCCSNLADSGLLLLSNINPIKSGFEPFEDKKCDDSLTNKGFLHAYFEISNKSSNNKDEKLVKILVINTHLQAAGDCQIRLMQMNQIKTFINEFERFETKLDKIIIIGDFNTDMSTHTTRAKVWIEKNKNTIAGISPLPGLVDDENKTTIEDINNMNGIEDKINDIMTRCINDGDKDGKGGEVIVGMDPLTMMPYSDLPIESVPGYVRNILESRNPGKRIRKEYVNIPYCLGNEFGLIKVNGYDYTFKGKEFNIDHMFTNFKCQVVKEEMKADEIGRFSDHKMISIHLKSI